MNIRTLFSNVQFPAIRFKPDNPLDLSLYISKITSIKLGQSELDSGMLLRQIDPHNKYCLYPVLHYMYSDNKIILYIKYGGKSLDKYFDYFEHLAYSGEEYSEDDIKLLSSIIYKMVKLLKFIYIINSLELYHNDLSFDNLLYDGESIRIIDFGNTSKNNDVLTMISMIETFIEFLCKITKRKYNKINLPLIRGKYRYADVYNYYMNYLDYLDSLD